MKRSKANRLTVLAILATGFLLSGCSRPTDFTYGQAADDSPNGLSVFANLLRERGHSVVRKRRLTNRINRFDTIVWAPDNRNLPPENVVAWLEEWLASSGTSKVLIYIGRSYDAKLPFFERRAETASAADKEEWQRQQAEVILRERNFGFDWHFGNDDETAFWFDTKETDGPKVKSVVGPWADEIDTRVIDLECSELLVPLSNYDDESNFPMRIPNGADESQFDEYDYGGWLPSFRSDGIETNELLTVDGQPFAFEICSKSNRSKIIVISNGSFILNFPLINPEHRKLAKTVADEVTGDVVFLESGLQWPRVGGAGNDPSLQWQWIGKAPMTYIVPHFLFWGVLYIFAFFPNFGRPKRLKFHPPKAFKNHVEAVASILRRSKEKEWAQNAIETWRQRNKS